MANTLITQLNNPAVLQKANQRLATIVSLLLIVACVYLLAEITWMLFLPQEASSPPASRRALPVVNKQAQQDSFRNLSTANLFGESEKVVAQQSQEAPETKLNLTLKGVLAMTPSTMASAIIAQGKAGQEDIYSVGDKMAGGVLIKDIFPTYVVLERSGRLETLRLPKDNGDDLLQLVGDDAEDRKNSSSIGGSLKEIRANILKSPTSFADYALPVLVKENGKQIGYRLQPQKDGELLSELGIQSTDVIIQINGVTLDNQENAISALRDLSTAKNLDIVVKRDGAEIPMNISLQ